MTRLFLVVALLVSVILPTHAFAADTMGYVDMQSVLEKSKLGQRLQDQLREQFEQRGQAMAEEEQAIRQRQQTLERDGPLMSADQVSKEEAEIATNIKAFQEKAGALQQEIMKVQQEKSREILGPAKDSINAVAKKREVGIVLESSMSGLLYVDKSLDLTDDVIKHIDANAK
jgi:outer membrane protein